MSSSKAQYILPYWKLESYLTHELGYSKEKAAQSIAAVRRMEPHILHLFLSWFRTDKLPRDTIHGVCVQDIITHCAMDPVAAFLALNWVQVAPAVAKYSLSRPIDTLEISENDMQSLQQIARERGWTPLLNEAPLDESDLIDPIFANYE